MSIRNEAVQSYGFNATFNHVAQDSHLKASSRGLLAYLASHSENYLFKKNALANHFQVGTDTIKRWMKPLRDKGYVVIKNFREKETGQWSNKSGYYLVREKIFPKLNINKDKIQQLHNDVVEIKSNRGGKKPTEGKNTPLNKEQHKIKNKSINTLLDKSQKVNRFHNSNELIAFANKTIKELKLDFELSPEKVIKIFKNSPSINETYVLNGLKNYPNSWKVNSKKKATTNQKVYSNLLTSVGEIEQYINSKLKGRRDIKACSKKIAAELKESHKKYKGISKNYIDKGIELDINRFTKGVLIMKTSKPITSPDQKPTTIQEKPQPIVARKPKNKEVISFYELRKLCKKYRLEKGWDSTKTKLHIASYEKYIWTNNLLMIDFSFSKYLKQNNI